MLCDIAKQIWRRAMFRYNILNAHSFVGTMKETENLIPNDIAENIKLAHQFGHEGLHAA